MSRIQELRKLPEKWRICAAKCESVAKANATEEHTWFWTEGCGETYARCADELDGVIRGEQVIETLDG